MAFVFHGRLGGYLLLTICLSTCLSVFGRTLTKNRKNGFFPGATISQDTLPGVDMTTIHGRRFDGFRRIPYARSPVGDLRFKKPSPPTAWNETLDSSTNTTTPEVTIPQGTLHGVNMTTLHGRTVAGFMGIPYAQPPVGDLRFRAPVPAASWNGTLNASSSDAMCPQMKGNESVGDEDCLYLNVFTPKLPRHKSSPLLPVIFYIHGGGHQEESNTYLQCGPDFLLDKDVILVVPNYRLGTLGYLSTGDEASPGNYGVKDMIAALEWNRDNIKHFGGDPERVTLLGSSSGAMTVSMFLFMNIPEGLFHQTIQIAGSSLMPELQGTREVAAGRAVKLADHLGCPTNTSTLLIDCLRGLNASQIVNTTSLFKVSDLVPYSPAWHPIAEPDIEGAVMTKPPHEMLASGKVRDLPSIRTNVPQEGLVTSASFYTDKAKLNKLRENLQDNVPYMLVFQDVLEDIATPTSALMSYYLNDPTANDSVLLTNLTRMFTDVLFLYPSYEELNSIVALVKSPQYYMSLEYRDAFSYGYYFSGKSTEDFGIAHCDELIYLFPDGRHETAPESFEFTETDLKMVDTMVELFTSFAINGKPNAMDKNGKNIWEPYSSSSKNYLRVGNGKEVELEAKYGWNQERMEFLTEVDAMMKWIE